MGLAGATGTQCDDIAPPLDPFPARQFQHQCFVQ